MTNQEIIDQIEQFTDFDLDNFKGEVPSDADLVSLLNWALRAFSIKTGKYDDAVVLTLTNGTALYSLRDLTIVSKRVVDIDRVVINGNQLWNKERSEYGLWSLNELVRTTQTYLDTDSGTPTRAVQIGSKLRLWQKPNATVVSTGLNYIAGTVLAVAVTNDQNATTGLPAEPDMEEELHEALGYYASVKAATPIASEREAWQRLTTYNSMWMEAVSDVANRNKRLRADWGSTHGYNVETVILT